MENNERKSFTFNPQYIDAVEDLENIDKWRAIYCLGYFGVYGDFPEGGYAAGGQGSASKPGERSHIQSDYRRGI